MISTRGRYALRVMADIAEHADKKYVPMKEVAQRQGISLKYLERILPVLTQNGFLEGLKRWWVSSCKTTGGVQDWRYFAAHGGRSGSGCLSGEGSKTLWKVRRMPHISDVGGIL